jgi:TatD family-associated radical SAM protein
VKNSEPSLVYWLGNSLYLNITNQCSNHCWFCFRNFKQGIDDFNLKLTAEPGAEAVIAALKGALLTRRWNEAVFCGFGEPTSRLDVLLKAARWMKTNHPYLAIRLDTNGQGYALNKGRDVAKELKAAGVCFASVSLNGYDEQTYAENCRPSFGDAFEAVLDFIKRAKREFPVEVTAIRMPEVDITRIRAVAEGLGVPFRIRDYFPCFW